MSKGTQGAVKVTTVSGVELTPMGGAEGVEYARTSDGRFAVLFNVDKPAPSTTKYGTPAWHFGGRGQDRPVFDVNGVKVAVNPGTLSAVKPEADKARKVEAKAAKVLANMDPEVLVALARLAGQSGKAGA